MYTHPALRREIQKKREKIANIESNDLSLIVRAVLNSALESEALQHSLRIELPLDKRLNLPKKTYSAKSVRKAAQDLSTGWHYANLEFKLPMEQEFLIKLARIVEPHSFQTATGYRNVGVRPSGATITPPYAGKLELCMARFYTMFSTLLNQHTHKETGNFELAAWAHHQVLRIHPFEDGNGRTARMLHNLILNKSGDPPIVIKENERKQYITILDAAHVGFQAREGELNPQFCRKKISVGEQNWYDYMGEKLDQSLTRVLDQYQQKRMHQTMSKFFK